jgi:hypothetical protein
VKLNSCATNDPCALCGFPTDQRVGPDLFLGATWHPVCYECGKKHAPELTYLVSHDSPAPYLAYVEQEINLFVSDDAYPRTPERDAYREELHEKLVDIQQHQEEYVRAIREKLGGHKTGR